MINSIHLRCERSTRRTPRLRHRLPFWDPKRRRLFTAGLPDVAIARRLVHVEVALSGQNVSDTGESTNQAKVGI